MTTFTHVVCYGTASICDLITYCLGWLLAQLCSFNVRTSQIRLQSQYQQSNHLHASSVTKDPTAKHITRANSFQHLHNNQHQTLRERHANNRIHAILCRNLANSFKQAAELQSRQIHMCRLKSLTDPFATSWCREPVRMMKKLQGTLGVRLARHIWRS